MTNPISKLLKYTDTVTFDASGNLADSIDRLSQFVNKPILQAALGESSEPSLVGKVSRENVRLHKVTPFFGNVFKPIFFGKFQTKENRVILVGQFKMGFVAQLIVWISVIVGFATQIIALSSINIESGFENLRYFEPSLFMLIGILVVLSGKMSRKRDVFWIKKQIESVLK